MAAFVLNLQRKSCNTHLLKDVLCATTQTSRQLGNVPDTNMPLIQSQPVNMRKGTGGRSSFSGRVATVFGAQGFLGRFVIFQLGRNGTQMTLPYRGDEHFLNRNLKLAGDLGKVRYQHFFLKNLDSVYEAIQYSDLVINLMGRFYETPNFKFEDIHVTGARNVARIARECGVKTLVHVSALNACEKPEPVILKKGSQFLASKWRGEIAVREEFPDAIIFRPSVMFGQRDSFCNYYGRFCRRTFRAMPLWNRGIGIYRQPVYGPDVAKGIVTAALDPSKAGQTIQAFGPHRYEFSEMMDWFYRVWGLEFKNGYIRLPLKYDLSLWFRILYSEFFFRRTRSLSFEKIEWEHITDFVDPSLPSLSDLGINLTSLESRIFEELYLHRAQAQRDPLSREYIRPVKPAPIVQGV